LAFQTVIKMEFFSGQAGIFPTLKRREYGMSQDIPQNDVSSDGTRFALALVSRPTMETLIDRVIVPIDFSDASERTGIYAGEARAPAWRVGSLRPRSGAERGAPVGARLLGRSHSARRLERADRVRSEPFE
jgi:hypothetical protein